MKHKIAIIIDPWDFPYNGTVVSTKRFIAKLKHQFEFSIFATGEAQEGKVLFKELTLPLPWFNRILEKMKSPLARPDKKLLRQSLQGCDVLHVQYPLFLSVAAVTVAKDMNIPVLCSFHVQPENILRNIKIKSSALVGLLYRLFFKVLYSRADMVIAPSQFAANLLQSHGLKTPIQVISNGVPDSYLALEKPAEFNTHGPFTLLSVGRFAKEKHQPLIMQALALSKHHKNFKLVLVGAGPEEKKLRKLAATMPYEIQIGEVSNDELNHLYQHADLFVHAGEIELEGMSVMEAMASELCIVVANAQDSAAKDFAMCEQSLFNFPNAHDLTTKVDYWLDNPQQRQHSAQQNREQAKQFCHTASSRKIAQTYTQLIAQK